MGDLLILLSMANAYIAAFYVYYLTDSFVYSTICFTSIQITYVYYMFYF
jgi:hypothetical protein